MEEMKVVFHLDFDDTPAFDLAIVNITNLLKDVKDAKVVLLANGFAVKLFVKSSARKYAEKLEELSRKGVRFYVCSNALRAHGINRDDVFEFCEIVPAGVTKLVELQELGYAYIKP